MDRQFYKEELGNMIAENAKLVNPLPRIQTFI